MEPPRPSIRQKILAANPSANPADIDEYERLLSERFRRRPDGTLGQTAEMFGVAEDDVEPRIAALYAKLFTREPMPT